MKKTALYYISILVLLIGCTEPYALQNEDFEDAIVVESTLTNELKKQEVKISRTFPLEQSEAKHEANAVVYILDNLGNRYDFQEVDKKYVSLTEFQAIPNNSYQLYITTNNGKSYTSTSEKLPSINNIGNVIPRVITKNGLRGVEIIVNSNDPTNSSKYYRYEYNETSRITAPKWNAYDAILLNNPRICYSALFEGFETIGFQLRNYESLTCYKSANSNAIILTNTTNLSEDTVSNFPVRFISNQDYTIAERYSIEVTQYVQNYNAHSYYKVLKTISESGGILSGNQPGLVKGNLKSLSNSNENVLGLFEVASVSKERIFFNFTDIFPGDPFPKYYTDCTPLTYDSMDFGTPDPRPGAMYPCGSGGQGSQLRGMIRDGLAKYYTHNFPDFYMVKPMCGDCTTIASNIKPTYWID